MHIFSGGPDFEVHVVGEARAPPSRYSKSTYERIVYTGFVKPTLGQTQSLE